MTITTRLFEQLSFFPLEKFGEATSDDNMSVVHDDVEESASG